VETVYLVGLFAGLGASLGLAFAGLLAGTRGGYVPAAVLGAVVAVLLGLGLAGWPEAIAGALGGLLGGAGAGPVVRGTLDRGGTRGATALLVFLVALGAAVLAFIPLVGYVEAVALPLLARRIRSRGGERYAGLRSLR
jgi:hypothetical protein